jgi:hypothetical protein
MAIHACLRRAMGAVLAIAATLSFAAAIAHQALQIFT